MTIALSTLLGYDQQPGELDGHGPIPTDLALRLAADPTATWRRLITDEHGRLLDYGRTTYRPPADLTRHVIARDQTCRFPTCNRKAHRCELDHTHPWHTGGTTDPANLNALCRRHHHAKHDTGWQPQRLTDGTIRWTSPTGHTYLVPASQLPDRPHHRNQTAHRCRPASAHRSRPRPTAPARAAPKRAAVLTTAPTRRSDHRPDPPF